MHCLLYGNYIRVALRHNKQSIFEPHSAPSRHCTYSPKVHPCTPSFKFTRSGNLAFCSIELIPMIRLMQNVTTPFLRLCTNVLRSAPVVNQPSSFASHVIVGLDPTIFRRDYPVKMAGNDMLLPLRGWQNTFG